ncbi:serine hydrolase [Streptomyces sp. NPDC055796]
MLTPVHLRQDLLCQLLGHLPCDPLGDLPADQAKAAIRDAESLLSLAGFRDLDHYTADDLRTLAYRQDQRAVPEGRFLYSNTNYLLMTEILQTVHGTTLPGLARYHLFKPLGMNTTHFKTDPLQIIPRASSAYRATFHGWQHTEAPVTLPGPGTLWTTADDLDRWLAHLHQYWQCEYQLPWAGRSRLPIQRPPAVPLRTRPLHRHPPWPSRRLPLRSQTWVLRRDSSGRDGTAGDLPF